MDFFLKTTFINPRNRHGNTRGVFQVPDNRPIQVLCTTTRLLELVVWIFENHGYISEPPWFMESKTSLLVEIWRK